MLVDPFPMWLDVIDQLFERIGFRVAGRTTSLVEGLELIAAEQPDLVVAEINGSEGELGPGDFLRRARERLGSGRLIVLSSSEDTEDVVRALVGGAVAYVVKTTQPDDLAFAVRQAFDRSIYFTGVQAPAPVADLADIPLTRREIEILRLVADGRSNAELARVLWVTEQTVKFHLTNIYRKLGVGNRTEASRWAQLHGLLAPLGSAASPQIGD